MDVLTVAAIFFHLNATYQYQYLLYKYKVTKRARRKRWWMITSHRKRTVESMEMQFQEMLAEPSNEFHNFCRMSYTDFELLLQKVDPIISKRNTNWRDCIPTKTRLALTLRFLASGDSYRSLHYLFKISSQAISKIVQEVCAALYQVLKDRIKIILAAIIAVGGAAKLDRTYLPPASAKTAGGSPGAIQAPNSFSQDAAPKGSYTNEFQGVVVDAALAGTRASESEVSGLGGPRNSYGSTASKVGDAAFRRSQAGFRFPVRAQDNFESPTPQFASARDPRPDRPQANSQFGASRDSSPEGSQDFGASRDFVPDRTQSFEVSRPERPQAAQDRAASILRFENEVGIDSFNYAFETDNGISAEETGVATNGVQAKGGFSYTGDDGKVYTVTYTADEDGYQPRGDHLPTPPPIPEEILKSLEQNARDEANGVVDDGLYDAEKYNDGGDYTESDSVNGKQNGRPSVNTGNTDVDASGTFINQNNLPFNQNNPRQRGSGDKKPANRFQSTSNSANGQFQSTASGNRFGSRNEYLPPLNNENRQQNSRPQFSNTYDRTSDADPSSTFQQEFTEQGSGDFNSQVKQQSLDRPSASSSFVSRPGSETKFNGFNQQGSSNGNRFIQNGNRFSASQDNRQPQFNSAAVKPVSHNAFSAQSNSQTLTSQHSTSIPETELTTPLESSPHDDNAQPSAPTASNNFGFNAQSSRPVQSQFGFHNSQQEASQAPIQPTVPSFTKSRPQNNRPFGGSRNTQTAFSTQPPQAQFNQPSPFGNQRPQYSQSQNTNNRFSSSTQNPQFAQQLTAQDDSYYYNQPSRTFNTPDNQNSRFLSAPSNQFDRVTQRPSFSSQTTQYSEEQNYPSTPFPSQNRQRQGTTRYPRPTTLPTESTSSNNQFQGNAIASTANGITQASASSFAAPTSSTGFNSQQFGQSRQQYQQPSFQSNRPSLSESKKPFDVATTAKPQSSRGQSPFEQQNFEKAQPLSQQPLQDVKQPKLDDDKSPAVTNLQYNGEIYEYNKPAEMLPPPENGFGQFGQKVQSSQNGQTRPQFSQSSAVESQQPTSGPSFSSSESQFSQTRESQDSKFTTRPKFGQNFDKKTEQPTSGRQPMRFSQTTKAPVDQFNDQSAVEENATDDFSIKPLNQQVSQHSTQEYRTEEQSVNNQFVNQRRPFNSGSPNRFTGSTAESPKNFGTQNGRPPCCKFFGQSPLGQSNQPSQIAGESKFGSQSSFQGSLGFKPDQSQSVAGKGEVFGGPRKPPSFDETGYHY